jgi:hypothetical protein
MRDCATVPGNTTSKDAIYKDKKTNPIIGGKKSNREIYYDIRKNWGKKLKYLIEKMEINANLKAQFIDLLSL